MSLSIRAFLYFGCCLDFAVQFQQMADEIRTKKARDSGCHPWPGTGSDGMCRPRKTGTVVYNSSAVYDCMGYEIIRDAETFDYYLRDTSTKETYPLARSPVFGVFSEDEEIRACYVCPPYLYYTTSVMESHVNRVGNYNTNMTRVSVGYL